ncbi:hypothetical protein LJC62_01925 [Odoribacter sp. OttesenSCG-928-A06]|nr:hypothetical protein [Odoribacter sp. OttesenSCG-928-A06]
MKKLLKINLLLCLFGLLFVACSSDDDPEPGPDPGPVVDDPTSLATPTNLSSYPEEEGASVAWDSVVNAHGYEVSLEGGDPLAANDVFYAFRDLEQLTDYSWKVRAVRTQQDGTILASAWAESSFTTLLGDTTDYGRFWIGEWESDSNGIRATGTAIAGGGIISVPVNFNEFIDTLKYIKVAVDVTREEGEKQIAVELQGLDTLGFAMPEFTTTVRKNGFSKEFTVDETRKVEFPEPIRLGDFFGELPSSIAAYGDAVKDAKIHSVTINVTKVSMKGSLDENKLKMLPKLGAEGKMEFEITDLGSLEGLLAPLMKNMNFKMDINSTLEKKVNAQ